MKPKYLVLVLLLAAFACTEKIEVEPRGYPRVKTLSVSNISDTGAKFNAEILSRNDLQITSYGFVWSKSESLFIESSDRLVIFGDVAEDNFSYDISTSLEEGLRYFVKSFITTDEHTVYGDAMSFISLGSKAPLITELLPSTGTVGDTIALKGQGFSYKASSNIVMFNTFESNVISATDTLLKVVVPDATAESYEVSVTLSGNTAVSDNRFIISSPIITNIEAESRAIDDTLSLRGSNFSYVADRNEVFINNVLSQVVYSDKSLIKVIVPVGLVDGQNSVVVNVGIKSGVFQNGVEFQPPNILAIDKRSGTYGEIVTIRGENFSFIEENNKVLLRSGSSHNDRTQCDLVLSNRSEISFVVTNDLFSSSTLVELEVAGRVLQGGAFQIDGPSISSVAPFEFSDFDLKPILIKGRNFNSMEAKNVVSINNVQCEVLEAKNDELLVQPARELIPFEDVSVFESYSLRVETLDQSDMRDDAISIQYLSKWLQMADFPGEHRLEPITFEVNGKGFVGLGRGQNDLWSFDPELNKWERKADFPKTELYGSASFVIGKKLYLVGGVGPKLSNNNREGTKEVWEYDVALNIWTQRNDFPGKNRVYAFAISLSGHSYVGGGRPSAFVFPHYNDFWEYNVNSDSWIRKNDLSFENWNFSFFNLGSISDKAYIYAWGSGVQGFILAYDKEIDSWQLKGSFTPRPYDYISSSFLVGDEFYLGLASSNPEYTGASYFHSFNTITDTWSTFRVNGDVKRNRGTLFTIDDKGYVIFGNRDTAGSERLRRTMWQFDPRR